MSDLPPSPDRRQLLRRAAAIAVTAATTSTSGCSAPPPRPDGAGRRDDFIIHTDTDWKTRPDAFDGAAVTPHGSLYVCNHLPFPGRDIVADPAAWRLEVHGVRAPMDFSLEQLRALGTESVTMVLQCADNGRRFFEHRPDGPIWGIGAVGCVTWTGVPLERVVAAAGGLDGSARYAIATGGEAVNPLLDQLFSMRVERSVPLDKALDDCLLACDMNGAPIPLVHGGPLRLIVPGYFGVNQIKYLKRLAFTREQSGADVMRREYRLRPIGKDGDATQPTTWAMGAKSTIWPVANSRVRRGRLLHGAHGELDAGTDDQLGKAFVFPDPPARIAALVRRPTAGMEPDVLRDRIRRWTSAGGRGSTGGEWKRTRTSRHRPGRAQPRFSRHRSSPCA